MSLLKTTRSKTIEIKFATAPAAGTTIEFGQDKELQNVFIDGWETYNNTELSTTTDGSGNIVNATKGRQIMVFLKIGDTEQVRGFPYQAGNTALNSGLIRQLRNFPINFNKSYIKVVSVADAIAANDALAINFHFRHNSDTLQPQMGM